MDPVTVVVAALGAGAVKGSGSTAGQGLRDAYAALGDLLVTRFAAHRSAQVALSQHATDPLTWQAVLTQELRRTHAAQDTEVLSAAQHLLSLADRPGTRMGKYAVDVRAAQVAPHGDPVPAVPTL